MPKCEYYEPKLLEGEREQPGIPVDAMKLLGLLLRAEPMMSKVNRMRYCNRAIDLILDVLADFQNAYDFEEDRYHFIVKLNGSVAKFIRIMRIIGETNAISIPLEHETMSPNEMKVEMVRHLASLDEGMTKWRMSVIRSRNKGKTSLKGAEQNQNKKGDSTATKGGYE